MPRDNSTTSSRTMDSRAPDPSLLYASNESHQAPSVQHNPPARDADAFTSLSTPSTAIPSASSSTFQSNHTELGFPTQPQHFVALAQLPVNFLGETQQPQPAQRTATNQHRLLAVQLPSILMQQNNNQNPPKEENENSKTISHSVARL